MISDNRPFLSVVIPVYNSELYLNDCLASIVSQSFTDFELILVDDDSTDKSGSICEEWKRKYPDKIQVIHQKNTGVYIAKRNGIKSSRGLYIYVMDNDDLIVSNDAFRNIQRYILEGNFDLVIFNATDNIDNNHKLCNIPFKNQEIFENDKLKVLYDEFLKTKNLHHIWMMVFHRNLFDWDYEYKEDFRMLRDGPALILPIISNAQKVLYLKDIFYYWRVQNQHSASKHYDVVNFYNSIKILHKRIVDYSQHWKYKTNNTDKLVRENYVTDICIAAIKVRNISPSSISKKDFLQILANDEMFVNNFSVSSLELYRKLIAYALYKKHLWLVNFISFLVGFIKGR